MRDFLRKEIIRILTVFLFFLIASLARAEEPGSRRVINGTILHTAEARAPKEVEAVFRAEQESVRALIVECSIPHREIKVFDKKVWPSEKGYQAQIQSGITFEDCEEGKKARSKEERARLSSPRLVREQEIYLKLVEKELGTRGSDLELKDYLEGEFSQIHDTLDETNQKIDSVREEMYHLKASQGVSQMIQEIPATDAKAGKSLCRAQAQTLMDQANQAALSNHPPGNLAQGQAATFYNQAQTILASCQ